jgi:hypothetical protein
MQLRNTRKSKKNNIILKNRSERDKRAIYSCENSPSKL